MFTNKYRPSTLNDVIGQDKTIKELKKRSLKKDFAQVQLYINQSGAGKTTTAFIVSAILNCKNPKNKRTYMEPCGECSSCKSIMNQTFNRDTLFFDGAKMGKEDVLQLESTASSAPIFDKNKIIIIDEAQNLISQAAKGATLKLLEKKRDNVYFILCTMEPEKLHKALKARGQKYYFNPVDEEVVGNYLMSILEKENIDYNSYPETFLTEVLVSIVENCEGSVREALSMLERAVNSNLMTEAEIVQEFNLTSHSSVFSILERIVTLDKSVLPEIQKYQDIQGLFRMTRKFLVDAIITSEYSGNSVKPRYKQFLVSLGENKNRLYKLLDVYSKVNRYEIDKIDFLSELCLFFNSQKARRRLKS